MNERDLDRIERDGSEGDRLLVQIVRQGQELARTTATKSDLGGLRNDVQALGGRVGAVESCVKRIGDEHRICKPMVDRHERTLNEHAGRDKVVIVTLGALGSVVIAVFVWLLSKIGG